MEYARAKAGIGLITLQRTVPLQTIEGTAYTWDEDDRVVSNAIRPRFAFVPDSGPDHTFKIQLETKLSGWGVWTMDNTLLFFDTKFWACGEDACFTLLFENMIVEVMERMEKERSDG